GVIFLTISSKVTLDELVKFFKRISQPAEIIRKSERLDNFMKKENIENIKLKMLEIAELPISEEEEILVGKTPKEEFGKENFWILLIKGLVIKYSDISNELSSLEKALGISPKKLAEIIDKSFDLDITKSPNFQEFMEIYFKSVRSASKYPIVNNEIKKKIEDFVLNLSSNKKAIFLIKNIEYAEKASPEERKLLRNLFDKTFLEVLKHAISQKEDLPEKILRLLGSSSIVNIPRKKLQEYIEKVRRRRASSLLKDFYRADDIVIYQPENYKKILDDFISQMEVKEMEKPTATDLEEFHQTLLEENMQKEMLYTLLELLDTKLDKEEYQKILFEIKNYFNIFLITGRFKEVTLILNALSKQEEKVRKEPDKLKILNEISQQLKNINVLNQLVKELRSVWGEEKYAEIKETILQFGRKGINFLIDLLSKEEDKFTRSLLVDLLAEFGPQAIDIIEKKLDDPKWYVIRNMILILRKMGNKTLLPKIQSLCNHPEPRVKIEALKSLLYFQEPSGINYLIKFLNSEDKFIRNSALSLAGAFRVREVVNFLLQNLKNLKMNRKDFEHKLKIIQVLGLIGDPRAIDYLKKEIRKTYFFHFKRRKILKRVIYNSLKNYPFNEIQELLEKGLKSTDKEIRLTCKKLLEIPRE
ncbi:HEAT repeat domain-containing protein, partial [SCandidatus Aminicenantes bacterium Aminicenantia_JdfR_composite]|nr:HEAT repeat domain-containing protein [SCandidatus Aminicenantes bacterium Aminicenantia_JdfR_composite]